MRLKTLLVVYMEEGRAQPITLTPEGIGALSDLELMELKDCVKQLYDEIELEVFRKRL